VIVVDTNVISELMRGEPHPTVLAWAAAQPHALLYATHIIPKLPHWKRPVVEPLPLSVIVAQPRA
jgi:hypothetical protein